MRMYIPDSAEKLSTERGELTCRHCKRFHLRFKGKQIFPQCLTINEMRKHELLCREKMNKSWLVTLIAERCATSHWLIISQFGICTETISQLRHAFWNLHRAQNLFCSIAYTKPSVCTSQHKRFVFRCLLCNTTTVQYFNNTTKQKYPVWAIDWLIDWLPCYPHFLR